MPVDTAMLDAMLGTFRNMLQECRDKKMSGEDFDKMESALQRMEQLGQEMSDVGAYSGQLVQEGLFMQFSDHYGKLLAAAARPAAHAGSVYDEAADKALLQQTLSAYRDAISRLKDSKEQTRQLLGAHASDADVLFRDKAITDAIQNVITLGESGISYPAFLSEMIRKGLDKAMEGSALSREALVYLLEAAKATAAAPLYIQKEEEKLALFDTLAKDAKAGVPDHLQYTLGCEKIEWTHQPAIHRWNKQKTAWEKAHSWLDEWITSYCDFAPHIEPWAQAAQPREAVIESQDTVPGKLRVWEKINQRSFALSLNEFTRHETFAWDVQYHWMYWSQEYLEFLWGEVEPLCRPGQRPTEAMIAKAAAFHKEKRKINPALGEPSRRYAAYFDRYFGKGEFARRFGLPEPVETHAAPWDPVAIGR